MSEATVRYLTTDELVYINGKVLNDAQILRGERQIREMERLEAAVLRPMTSAFGQDAYPTLAEKAAVLLHSVTRNHPFANGNKRTATVALVMMLAVNGQAVQWNPPDALEWVLAVAQGKRSPAEFADWLPTIPHEPTLEQDAERDMALIDSIINTNQWLLEELDKR